MKSYSMLQFSLFTIREYGKHFLFGEKLSSHLWKKQKLKISHNENYVHKNSVKFMIEYKLFLLCG